MKRCLLLCAAIGILAVLVLVFRPAQAATTVHTRSSLSGLVVVLDPGHGGVDHGAISPSGVKEDKLNLQVALLLRDKLTSAGASVVMTRQSADVDYSGDGSTRKSRDMNNRAKLIVASNADAVISIHMNYYPNKSYYGPQTYFLAGSTEGKRLADSIQSQLLGSLPSLKKFRTVEGNYLMLHASRAPAVLVECGFLSNPGDEKRLQDHEQQRKIAECIYRGICGYFGVQLG